MQTKINTIRAVIRLFLLFTLSLIDLFFIIAFYFISGCSTRATMKLRRVLWAKKMMWIGGMRLIKQGSCPQGGHLVVANHRSSIDPLVNLADGLLFPVAAIEFSRWPIIGQGAWLSGIVFVDRSSKQSRKRTREKIASALLRGYNVLIYPEGRTGNTDLTKLFMKGSFEVAAQHHIPVVPVVIEYCDRSDNWDHSQTFVPHFIKHFGKKRTYIILRYGPILVSDQSWTLMRKSKKWIDAQIMEIRSELDGPDWRLDPESSDYNENFDPYIRKLRSKTKHSKK